jgi:hypothetical protein
MVSRKSALAAVGALALGLSTAGPIHGSETSLHTNYLSFSGPVGLPGVALPAGTYIFERVAFTTPDVIVVRSRDRSTVLYMARTNRVARPAKLAPDRLVTFGEARPGIPLPIAAWYPMGESIGHAFVYGRR